MDSTNPFAYTHNFVDLLQSQQDSFSPVIAVGSSEVPLLSQYPDAPTQAVDTPAERRGRRKWTPTEDVVLISAWLKTSKDAVVGNEQEAATFWKRIATYFSSSPKLGGLPGRDHTLCKQRWQKINDLVCKFVGAYEAAKTQKTSGHNDNEVLKMAHQIFYNDHHIKFNLEHAWMELRNDQKWCASFNTKAAGSAKKRKCEDGTAQSSSFPVVMEVDGEAMARPIGVKAAKLKAKSGISKTSTRESEATSLGNFQSMWVIKEKDLAMKERVSKIGLLDRLVGKTEPLTETEIALKDKLISDMLSN